MAEQLSPLPPLPKGEQAPIAPSELRAVGDQMNGLSGRIRMGEERMNEIRNKLSFLEQSMLTANRKAVNELKSLNEEITQVRTNMNVFQDRMMLVIKELKLMARKEDVDVLKRYLDLWNPVKFVSQDQVEKLVHECLEEKGTTSFKSNEAKE